MNKTIAFLILGVILLAMALIMVNQYITQPGDAPVAAVTAKPSAPLQPEPPQAATPEEVLSRLEQRSSNAELAPRTQASTAPLAPAAMPAWASNAPQSATAPHSASGSAALTPPSLPSSGTGGMGSSGSLALPATPQSAPQGGTQATPAAKATAPQAAETPKVMTAATAAEKTAPGKTDTAKPAAAKPEPAKTEATKAAPVKAEAKPQAKTEAPKAAVKGPKTIKKIAVFTLDDAVAVRLDGSEEISYSSMQLKGPDRLVVDLEGDWAIRAPGVPNNKFVSNVRIGKQGDKTRIVIDLRQTPGSVRFVKRGAGEGLDVRIK